jgi:transcriptional antiterminator NusG
MSTISNEKTNWYTLRVANAKENKIKEHITMVEGFDKYVSQVLVPQEKVVKIKDNKKIVMTKNLLPGYMLVEFKTDSPNPDVVKEIEMVKYVSGFLKSGDKKLLPLRKSELNSIIGNIEGSQETVNLLIVGESIVVTDGPFKGFNGFIDKIDHSKNSVDIIVKVFDRNTPLSLNLEQIEKRSQPIDQVL